MSVRAFGRTFAPMNSVSFEHFMCLDLVLER